MKRYGNNSLFIKIMRAFLILGVVPLLLLGLLSFKGYTETAERILLKNMRQLVRFAADNISDVIQTADEDMSAVWEYSTSNGGMLYEIIRSSDMSERDKRLYINNMLAEIVQDSEYILDMRFKMNDGSIYAYYKDGTKGLKSGTGFANELTGMTKAEYQNLFLLPAFDESRYCINSDDYVFTLARNYTDMSSLERTRSMLLGSVYADINVKEIKKYILADEDDAIGEYYVLHPELMECIYSNNVRDYGRTISWLRECKEKIKDDNGYFTKGEDYVVYAKVADTGYYALIRFDREEVLGSYMRIGMYAIFGLVLSAIMTVCLFLLFSRKISRPAEELKKAMSVLQAGDMSVRVDIHSQDEMEYLGEGFNHMAEKLNSYINQVYKAELKQKDAELNALKMQIQPHYLYNTLDVIRMKAVEFDDYQVAGLLESLSKQLRYLTGRTVGTVTLQEELDNIHEYFHIITVRYNGAYHLEVHVPDQMLSARMPRLILQPIIENAVSHGLRRAGRSGTVMISAEEKNGALLIKVMDNGVGISEEKLRELNRNLTEGEDGESRVDKSNHIGMENVNDRIRHMYGNNYGLTIMSKAGYGTVVTYRLPFREE